MKLNPPVTLIGALLALAGCGSNSQTSNQPGPVAAVTDQSVQYRYKDAAVATRKYVSQNKDEFIAAMGVKLKDLDARIDALARKSEGYAGAAKAPATNALAALSEQRKVANEKLVKAKQAGAAAWGDLKAGLESAVTNLEKACENVRSKFN